ncbi:unnamed protein product [Coffea canephora]|uniref:Uncharacterized protein n=1 Tax=Coffea canephora TaxID=49390 RepID=A0A068U8I1_COFCA|nr:unnamed protein product [Coffea canephora]
MMKVGRRTRNGSSQGTGYNGKSRRRFIVWTKSAFEKLDEIYRSFDRGLKQSSDMSRVRANIYINTEKPVFITKGKDNKAVIASNIMLDVKLHFHSDRANDHELQFSMVDGDFKKFEGKWSVKSGKSSSIKEYHVRGFAVSP